MKYKVGGGIPVSYLLSDKISQGDRSVVLPHTYELLRGIVIDQLLLNIYKYIILQHIKPQITTSDIFPAITNGSRRYNIGMFISYKRTTRK